MVIGCTVLCAEVFFLMKNNFIQIVSTKTRTIWHPEASKMIRMISTFLSHELTIIAGVLRCKADCNDMAVVKAAAAERFRGNEPPDFTYCSNHGSVV